VFTVGTSVSTNSPGRTYVAYLFAHNDGDGEFGEDADQDIIKCGSFTVGGSGTSVPVEEINLGFEAQWVLLKRTDNGNAAYQEWRMMDNMRGASVTGEYQVLYANSSTSEGTESSAYMYPTSTGFNAYFPGNASYPGAGATYMYIAIRRGPMKVPESSSEVFAIDDNSFAHGGAPAIRTPAVDVVDMGLFKRDTSVERWYLGDRLRQEKYLDTGSTAAETANSYAFFDYMNGWNNYATSLSDYVSYNFRRAPKFFDVVTWTGDGTSFNRRISHNLEQEPRLILLKARNSASYNWTLYYHFSSATVPHERFWFVNTGSPVYGTTGSYQYLWGNAPASTTDFGVGSYNNTANIDYVAYLFGGSNIATTGLYIGNGTSNTRYPTATPDDVRFLLIKEYSATSPWYLFDIERGIVAGNDPYLKLNATDAEVTTTDVIDPVPGGFTVNQTATENLNANGSYYLYYAIK
jgi:hypothetical protein